MSGFKISVLQIIFGLIVLTTGFKVSWFFVGVMFFVFGMYVLMDLFHMKSRWGIQIIGLEVGVIGIFLGIYLNSIALVMVSLIFGGYGSYYPAQLLGIKSGTQRWILFFVGGIPAIIVLATKCEWALVLFSS